MAVKEQSLTVKAPIPQKQLGRFRGKKGVVIIRQKGVVIYIALPRKIYKSIMRLFQKDGILSHLDPNRLQFEIIETSLRSPSVSRVLKQYFLPMYNSRMRKWRKSTYEKKQSKLILAAFLNQTRFEEKGEHQTDSKREDLNQI